MNFLAKTFGSLTGTSIPYTLGKVIQPSHLENPSSSSLWTIYDATSDKDSTSVAVFAFDLKHPGNSRYVPLAFNAMKKHMALALLPGVVTIVEVIENEKNIYIVTEHVTPITQLSDKFSRESKLLGIYQLARSFKFINVEGSCVHCNPRIENVYLTDSREWKVAGFEFTINYKDPSTDYLPLTNYVAMTLSKGLIIPPEFESSGSDFFKNVGKGAKGTRFDSFLFGILIYQILTNKTPTASEVLKSGSIDGLPLNKLVAPSLGMRITIDQFLKNGEMTYFATNEIEAYSRFSEFSLLDFTQKLQVYKSLIFGNMPVQFLEIKVLPQLAKSFEFLTTNENNSQTVLIYLMYLIYSKSMEDSKFVDTLFKSIIFKAFLLADRSVRVMLLKILPKVVDKMTKQEVQDKIYPNLVTGFADTDITVRTETLLSISYILDKITERQLNNDLLRYLAKLQIDSNPQLRANTVICLTRLSVKMHSNTRTGVLVTAFGKALKDSDPVTRLSAVRGFASSIDYFTPEICCSKVLSALAPALLDVSSLIRKEAEHAFELYMQKIRAESANLSDSIDEGDLLKNADDINKTLNNLSLENLGANIVGSVSSSFIPSASLLAQPHMNTEENHNVKKTDNVTYDDFDLDDEDDDGWGFDVDETNNNTVKNDNVTLIKNSTTNDSKSTHKNSNKLNFGSTNSVSTNKTLQLGKKKPSSKLILNVSPEEADDDGWGDGW